MQFNDPTNYIYIAAGIFSIVISILIIAKDHKLILNILFGSGMLFWGVSLTTNALTFLFKNPENIAAQLVRDITTSTGSIAAFLIFAASLSLYKGEYFLWKWYFIIPWTICMIANSIIASLFDKVVFETLPETGIKTTQKPWVMIFLYGIPILLIIVANIFLGFSRRELEEKLIRRRILFFILGFVFHILGVVLFAIYGIIEQSLGIGDNIIEYVTWIFASLFWLLNPTLMIIGFNIGKVKKKEINLEKID